MSKAEELANELMDEATYDLHHETIRRVTEAAAELRRLAALEKAIMDAEPVAWVNKGQIKSAEISRERGGPYDSHMWNECPTAFFQEPLYTLNGIKKP